MKIIKVKPHEGIGDILFGMKRIEVETNHLKKIYGEYTDKNTTDVTYDDYRIKYKDQKVIEIYIDNNNAYKVMLDNSDIFQTKAEELFDSLKDTNRYECDGENEYLSCTYFFNDLGVVFWRESVFHPDLLKEELYLKFIEKNKDFLLEEKRFWYFNQIGLTENNTLTPPLVKTAFQMPIEEGPINDNKPTVQEIRDIVIKYEL